MRPSYRKFSSRVPDRVLKDSFYVSFYASCYVSFYVSSYILLISLLILHLIFFVFVFLNRILLHRPPNYNAE